MIKTKTKMETDLTHDMVIGESEETDWFQVAVARGDEINDVRVYSLCFSRTNFALTFWFTIILLVVILSLIFN